MVSEKAAAKQKARGTSHESAFIGYRGPGLFDDARVRPSYVRAVNVVRSNPEFLESLSKLNRDEWIKFYKRLNKVCSAYWNQRNFDERSRIVHFKADAKPIAKLADNLRQELYDTPQQTRHAIDQYLTPRAERRESKDRLGVVEAAITQLRDACRQIEALKPEPKGKMAIIKICEQLWNEWETVTGRPFRRLAWQIRAGRELNGEMERTFSEVEACFVLSMSKAIDPELTIKKVRSGLTKVRMSPVKNSTIKRQP